MKVLLVSAYTMAYVKRVDRHPSLALLTLSAVLRRAGHSAEVLDLNLLSPPDNETPESFYIDEILKVLGENDFGMLGLNCLLSEHFPFVRQAAKAVKDEYPSLPVVIGGIHPTLFSKEIISGCPQIDAVVLGEGEVQVVALAEAYADGLSNDLHAINALTFRDFSGAVVHNKRGSFIQNLDDLPQPAWDLFDLTKYFGDHSTWYNPGNLDIKMSVPMLTSRSCPYDCSFCSIHPLMGKGLRLRSASLVVDEMEMLYNQYDLNYFGFVDDNLTLNKKHIIGICNEIVRRGMKIQFESINGYIVNSIDDEIAEALVSAGCVYVIMPIEHGNSNIRNNVIGKRLTNDKIFEVAEIYKKHNLLTRSYFIMGFPEETRATLDDTYNMIVDLELDMNEVFNLIPFPGTRLFEQAVKDDLLIGEVDHDRLWEGQLGLNGTVHGELYIKPYKMEIDELVAYREKFDELRILSERAKNLQKRKASQSGNA